MYCTLAGARCGVCDSSDPGQAHPPALAIDGSDRWWQSPSLQYGPAYHTVTLTLDLRKVYQASYQPALLNQFAKMEFRRATTSKKVYFTIFRLRTLS